MMDIEKLQKMCEEYLAFRESDEYHEDNDWSVFIYEAALEAVLGSGIWERFREIDRKKEIRRKQKAIDKLRAELDAEARELHDQEIH